MSRLILVIFSLFSVLLGGCAQKLANYDYNPGFNYASYQRYALQQSEKQTYQSLDGNRIEQAITKALAGRYSQSEQGAADFLVAYYLQAERKIDNSGVSFGFGVSGSNMGVGVSTGSKAKEKTEGKLILEVVDTQSNQLVWTAKATRNLLDSMNPSQREYLIQDVVQEMLANFPPQ